METKRTLTAWSFKWPCEAKNEAIRGIITRQHPQDKMNPPKTKPDEASWTTKQATKEPEVPPDLKAGDESNKKNPKNEEKEKKGVNKCNVGP